MVTFKRIDHTALHVANIEVSKNFYETHFGFETYFEHETPTGIAIAYLRLMDTILELTGMEDAPVKGFHFCLETDDFEGAVSDLKAASIELIQPPHKTAAREPREKNWQRVVFKGPDGELIELRG